MHINLLISRESRPEIETCGSFVRACVSLCVCELLCFCDSLSLCLSACFCVFRGLGMFRADFQYLG